MADAIALVLVVASLGLESRRRRIRENDLLLAEVLKLFLDQRLLLSAQAEAAQRGSTPLE